MELIAAENTKAQVKGGYKKTEVGVIPDDWKVVCLGDVLRVRHGKSQNLVESPNGQYPILASGGQIGTATAFLCDKPSVLIGRKGTIDRPQFMDTAFWTVDTLFYTEINKSAYPKFLYYKFLLIDWYSYNEASGVPSLNAKSIEKIKVSFPPTLEEQKAIAKALSEVDALISNLDKLITKKKVIKQGAMQQLLKSPKQGGKRLPGFEGEWEEKTLGEISEFYKGRGLPKSAISKSGSYKCIHYGELFTKYVEVIDVVFSRTDILENPFLSKSNDILMPTSDVTPNGLATASCVKKSGVILGGDILIIRIPESILDGRFLSFVISQNKQQIMQLVTGTTVYHLYASDMKKFSFSFPRIAEQTEIVKIISNMTLEIETFEKKKVKYQSIKQGMMQELLTGKTRLV